MLFIRLPTFPVLGTLQAPSKTWAEEDTQEGPWSHSDPDQRVLMWPLGAEHGVGGRLQLRRKVGRWFTLEIALDAPAGCFPQCWNHQKTVFLLPLSAKLEELLGRRA